METKETVNTHQHTQQVQNLIEELLTAMNIPYESVSQTTEGDRIVFMIITSHSKQLIGPGGETLLSLTTVARQLADKRLPSPAQFSLDVNYYRRRSRELLIQKARTIAERARSFQSTIEMEPMSSYQRFIVHDTLSNMNDIETYSEGSGRDRRVIVRYCG